MVRPANVTFSASGRSPEPSHTGHSTLSTNCSTRRRIIALWELPNVCRTWRSALENVPL
jgi:hypothetical protein